MTSPRFHWKPRAETEPEPTHPDSQPCVLITRPSFLLYVLHYQEKDCLALLNQELNTKPINHLESSDVLTERQWVPKEWQALILLQKEGIISNATHPHWIKIDFNGIKLVNTETFLENIAKGDVYTMQHTLPKSTLTVEEHSSMRGMATSRY